MRYLSKIIGVFVLGFFLCTCNFPKIKNTTKEKPVLIANDSLEYEIIIIDIGFNAYLNSIARPIGYYSKNYLENWNRIYVLNWNIRANNPQFNRNIYQNIIDYDSKINYGMDVNYKLFNYFQFAQRKYKMRLDGGAGPLVRIR